MYERLPPEELTPEKLSMMVSEKGFAEKFDTATNGGKNLYWTTDKDFELPIKITPEE